jgi:hypothetical protein
MDGGYVLSSMRVERNVLEAELDEEELWNSERYQELARRIAVLSAKESGETDSPDGSGPQSTDGG